MSEKLATFAKGVANTIQTTPRRVHSFIEGYSHPVVPNRSQQLAVKSVNIEHFSDEILPISFPDM